MTPGEEALREAARLESARIYSRTCPEKRAAVDDVCKTRASLGIRAASHADRAVSDAGSDSQAFPQATVYPMQQIESALQRGVSPSLVMKVFGIDYATVRAARKRLMRQGAA